MANEDDKDFKDLLKSLDASLNAQSFREDMRCVQRSSNERVAKGLSPPLELTGSDPAAWLVTYTMKQSGLQASAYIKERDAEMACDAARTRLTFTLAPKVKMNNV